jgi:phytanoyl-CoA hydroxylase
MSSEYNPQKVRADFRRDGFVVLRGFYSPNEMQEIEQHLARYLRDVIPTLPAEEAFYEVKGQPDTLKYAKNMDKHDAFFRKMYENERIVKLCELLLDGPVVGANLAMFNKPPRIGEQTPPHQDGFYFMLNPMEALTLWLALDRVDTENGCVRYVPGSHLKPMRPHQRTKVLGFSQGITDFGTPDDLKNEVAMTAQPGDLLAHHCMTIHRADPNRSDRTRRAIGIVYDSAAAKPDDQAIEAYQKKLMAELAQSGKI